MFFHTQTTSNICIHQGALPRLAKRQSWTWREGVGVAYSIAPKYPNVSEFLFAWFTTFTTFTLCNSLHLLVRQRVGVESSYVGPFSHQSFRSRPFSFFWPLFIRWKRAPPREFSFAHQNSNPSLSLLLSLRLSDKMLSRPLIITAAVVIQFLAVPATAQVTLTGCHLHDGAE